MDLPRVPWGFQGRPEVLGSDLTARHTLLPIAAVAVGTMVWPTAGVVVLLAGLVSASLLRAAEAMDEDRRTAAREGSPGLSSR